VRPARRLKIGRMLTRALVLCLAAVVALPAFAQSSSRSRTSEVYLGPVFTDGKSYSFEGGSSARTDTGVGLVLGFARNFDRHLTGGLEFEWTEQDYRATVQPGIGNNNSASQISGRVDSRTIRFFGTYHFLASNFTPFVTGGLGWTYIDTNIPAGLPELVCWYYPWYGQYCATYVPTETTTKFSYNAGLGLRLDAGGAVFRGMVNSQWVDFGGSYGSSSVLQWRLDIGTKF
jgi:opacity protein-like surface antigen